MEPEDYYARAVDKLIEDLNATSWVVEVERTSVYSVRARCEDGTTMTYSLQYQLKEANR